MIPANSSEHFQGAIQNVIHPSKVTGAYSRCTPFSIFDLFLNLVSRLDDPNHLVFLIFQRAFHKLFHKKLAV
jgi:hypothetical protein